MLNCYNLYAIVWTAVIILYDLSWSDYCQPLYVWLRLYIYISIIVCFILGTLTKNNLRYKKLSYDLNIGNAETILLCALQLIEYMYSGQIPLFNVILHGGIYSDFNGIPTLHVIIYTYATFYTQYLFYAYLNEKKIRYLRNYVIIVFVVYALQFMRGGLVVCLSISAIMLISSLQYRIKAKHIIITGITLLLVIYIFGGLGNIRHGSEWNDSSAFLRFARINDRFPKWLPSQFTWFYSYIVCSLATLNNNIKLNYCNPDFFTFFYSIIPDFISKRIWPNMTAAKPRLIWKGFTTTTGYFDAYYSGGIIGIYCMFFIILLLALLITNSNHIKEKYRVLTIANMNVIMALYFFTNAIHRSAIGFTVVYPIAFSFIRIKLCLKKKDRLFSLRV